MAGKTWDEVMNGEPLTPEDIKALFNKEQVKIIMANASIEMAKSKIHVLQGLCKHPNIQGDYCPDCGLDAS